MTNAITIRLAPVGDTPIPECRLGGTNNDIPIITWQSDDDWSSVTLSLGSHPNPGAYLMALAERLAEFAIEVDGIAAPIPYALTEKAAGQ